MIEDRETHLGQRVRSKLNSLNNETKICVYSIKLAITYNFSRCTVKQQQTYFHK